MSETRVVNLYKETYEVYIGRPGRGQDGHLGNPIVTGEVCLVCYKTHTEKGDTLPCYKVYLEARAAADESFRTRLINLKGRVLGCFCKPKPCHGDIIVDYLENNTKDE